MSGPVDADRPWRLQVVLLGLVTIGAFGLVLYAFGAFVGPIRAETGWSNGSISAAFAIATLGGGVLSLPVGRLLDRVGGQPVMAGTLATGSTLLWLASAAREAWQFVAAWGVGGAIVSAGLYYSATMAVTARITTPAQRPRAYTWLTVIGGLASPIAYPLSGLFIEMFGWRDAMKAMVAFMAALSIPAILFVRGDREALAAPDEAHGAGFGDVRSALASPIVRRWLLAGSAALAGLVAVQVHHVAAIEATGVSIGVASALAGLRGLLSLPGRAVAATVTRWVGIVNALRMTYATMTIGTLALAAAGAIGWVWIFVVLTGLAFGSVSPLQGLYAAELYGQRRIGTLMGMQQVVFGFASAAGPFALGVLIDLTDGYATMLTIAAGLQFVALVAFREPVSRPASAPATTP